MASHVFNLVPPVSLSTWDAAIIGQVNTIFNKEAYSGSGIRIQLFGIPPIVDGMTVQARESFSFNPDVFLDEVNPQIMAYGTIFELTKQ